MRLTIVITIIVIGALAVLTFWWDGFPAWLAQFRVDR